MEKVLKEAEETLRDICQECNIKRVSETFFRSFCLHYITMRTLQVMARFVLWLAEAALIIIFLKSELQIEVRSALKLVVVAGIHIVFSRVRELEEYLRMYRTGCIIKRLVERYPDQFITEEEPNNGRD